MKKLLFLSVAFTVFYVMQTPLAEGQVLFNYALGGDSFSPSGSVVRTGSDQKAIASYWDGTYNDPASTCYVIKDQLVKKLATSTCQTRVHFFSGITILPSPTSCNETYDLIPMSSRCITTP